MDFRIFDWAPRWHQGELFQDVDGPGVDDEDDSRYLDRVDSMGAMDDGRALRSWIPDEAAVAAFLQSVRR